MDPPRLVAAVPIEGHALRAVPRRGARRRGGALPFLDGTQSSRIIAFVNGIAIVHGTVGAVVRERRDQRMATWASAIEQRSTRRHAHCPAGSGNRSRQLGVHADRHQRRAGARRRQPGRTRSRCAMRRCIASAAIASGWSSGSRASGARASERMLFVDGGMHPAAASAVAWPSHVRDRGRREEPPHAVRGRGRPLRIVLSHGAGERSSVFRIASSRRSPVASWYLRLRDPRGTTRCGAWCASRSPTSTNVTRDAITARAGPRCRSGSSPRCRRWRCRIRGGTRWCMG